MGYREVNLNLGCPSGTVTAKGKGAGMLGRPEELDHLLEDVYKRQDRDQQGVVQIAELLAGDLLHLDDILHDLRLDLVVDLLAVLIVLSARLGGDGEALGHGQADVGHLGQVGALASQQLDVYKRQVLKYAYSFLLFIYC